MSEDVATELQMAASRIKPAVVALRVWKRLFCEEERERLGGNLEVCWRRFGTAGMWMKVRDVSLEEAVIDIAEAVRLMDNITATSLRRELHLDNTSAVAVEDRPVWISERGELQLGEQVIRRLRVMRNPSNIQQILDAFQTRGWPSRIKNPLKHGDEQLHQTLRSLNDGLEKIRFHAQKGAQAVTWKYI